MWAFSAAVVLLAAPSDGATALSAGDGVLHAHEAPLRIGAGPPAPAPAPAAEPATHGATLAQTDHPLDADGGGLETSLTHSPHPGGLELVGLIHVLFEHDTGQPFGASASGARLQELLLVAQATAGAWALYLELDAADADVGLGEAWGDVALDAHHGLRVGRVQRRFLASQAWPDDGLAMLERSRVDVATTVQSEGALLSGDYDRLRLSAALQNGPDGAGEDWLGTLRAEFDVLGGGVPHRGDGWRAPQHVQMTAGVAAADEGSVEEGGALALDAAFRWEGLGVFVEWVDLGRDVGDAQPLAATMTAQLEPDVLEAGVRYELLDDGADTEAIGVALTRWVVPGRLKVQVGADRVRSDDDDLQGTRFLLGTVLSF